MSTLAELIEVCHWMNEKNYSPATSGNYSLRIDENHLYVSASGVDKGKLKESDFLKMDLRGNYSHDQLKPSDEAMIHAKIMEMVPEANCVLHSHSITGTALSLFTKDQTLEFCGFELQKAFSKVKSHEEKIIFHIFENTQDINQFSADLEKNWKSDFSTVPCLILRGHGIYVWAETVQKAKRFLEGAEFLMAVKVEHIKMGLK